MSEFVVEEVEEELDEPRRVDLTLARIEPWSVLKISFLVSVALGIAGVIAAVILWNVLDGMNVFGSIENFLVQLGADSFLELMDYLRLPRVVAYATIFGILNVILITAITTVCALLYNLLASLVGGIHISLMDE